MGIALDEVLEHVEGSETFDLAEFERVATIDYAVALVRVCMGEIVKEVLVGIERVKSTCTVHGLRAHTSQVVVEKGTAVTVACPAVDMFLFGCAEKVADSDKMGIGFVDIVAVE